MFLTLFLDLVYRIFFYQCIFRLEKKAAVSSAAEIQQNAECGKTRWNERERNARSEKCVGKREGVRERERVSERWSECFFG